MSSQGRAEESWKYISAGTGGTNERNTAQAVKLTDITNEGVKKAVTPQLPAPKRRFLFLPGEERRGGPFASDSKQQEDDCDVGVRPIRPLIPSRHSEYDRAGPAHKLVRKDEFVDIGTWNKLLHPKQRYTKRCRPSENSFEASVGNADFVNQDDLHQVLVEDVGRLHITEDRPVRSEPVDELVGNADLLMKRRANYDMIKRIGRQLEEIEQGRLAKLHLDPADEDPMFAAVIPRPDAANSGDTAFHRGEPVRSSAGGTAVKTRPRTGSDNAGHLSPDDVTMPSRRGFGRTPVRRHSKSPTASPVPGRAPPLNNVLKTRYGKNASVEV